MSIFDVYDLSTSQHTEKQYRHHDIEPPQSTVLPPDNFWDLEGCRVPLWILDMLCGSVFSLIDVFRSIHDGIVGPPVVCLIGDRLDISSHNRRG